MIKKNIKIDFYQVEIGNKKVNFESILSSAAKIPNDSSRNIEKEAGDYTRLQDLSKSNSNKVWQGEMARIRMNDLPRKYSVDGKAEELELDDDEGIGDETAFLYDPKTNILVIQRNRNAVSASSLAWYMGKISGELVSFLPLMNDTALRRMAEMSEHRKLEIAIARPMQFKEFASQNQATGAFMRIIEYFDSPTVSVSVSMGREKGGLGKIVSFAKSLHAWYKDNPDEVKSITVSGSSADGTETIDLLADRLVEVYPVAIVEREIPANILRQAVFSAWSKQQKHLDDFYSIEG